MCLFLDELDMNNGGLRGSPSSGRALRGPVGPPRPARSMARQDIYHGARWTEMDIDRDQAGKPDQASGGVS